MFVCMAKFINIAPRMCMQNIANDHRFIKTTSHCITQYAQDSIVTNTQTMSHAKNVCY